MGCSTECQELTIYDYNLNRTVDITNCSCTGCCNNIYMFLYFLYFCLFIMTSILICEMSKYKKRERHDILINNTEQLPAYTEHVV